MADAAALTTDQLLGLDASHVVAFAPGVLLHPAVFEPLKQLQAKAKAAGFDLQVASGYRSFDRQCVIWNRKANGEAPVLDNDGNPLDINALSGGERVHAIMRWSALPGTSRHHWGSDFDIWDSAAVGPDYKLQLSVAETLPTGPFAAFYQWLEGELPSTCFYRPYDRDRNGVAVEPWHLSYAPLAERALGQLSADVVAQQLQQQPLALCDDVLAQLPQLYSRYVTNVSPNPRYQMA